MGKDIFSKKSRFSIRKLNIGVCSVLLGTLIMIGHTAQADETTSDGATVSATAVSASQGEGVAATTSPTTAPESVSTTTVTPAATETVAATSAAPTTSVAPSAAVSSEAPASTSVASSAPANSVATSTSPVVASEVTGSTNASTAKPATASEASRSVTASTTPSTTASSESATTNNISVSETANTPRVRSRRSIAQGATRSASTATRASDGAQNLDYSNKENVQDYVQISYEVDKLNNVLHWTVLDNPGRKANSASGYVYFTIPKDSVGAPTNWQVVQTDKNGKVVNTRNYWKDNDGSYLMGQNGRMDTYTGSEMTQRLTQLYKDIKNPAIQGNEAAVAAQTAERSQALYTMTADNNAIRNVMWTITFDTPIVDKSKPLDYVAGMQGTGVIGGRTNIMTGYADNFIDNESSKFQAVAVKEKYTAKVGGSFDATPANYVTNKAGTPEFPNNYRGATTFAWKDGQAPTATQAGTYTKTVVVTYPAHYNQAPQEVTITFEVQGETPKPVAPASQVPEITSNLNGKASTPADVTVNATAGSTVKLYNNDGVVIGEAVANDQGVATVHPTNSLPEGEITATSTPAGGSESAKSAPITVTKTQLTYVGGGVSGDNYTQLLVTESHLTVYPGDPVNVTIQAAGSPSVERFWIPNNPYLAKGLAYTNDSNGGFLDTAGSNTYRQRKAYYHGNVDMTQSAGSSTATYAVKNKNGKVVTRNLTITVLETAKKYEPTPGGAKVEVADPNNISATEKAAIEKTVGDANTALPQGTTYVADEKGNVTITYPDKSVDKIAAAYLVTPAKDTTAPDKPVVNTDLTGKAGTKPSVEVTAEPGSTVALYDKDNNKIGEATAGENGKATITPTVDIPVGNVTAKATDAAGNTSVASDPKVATDTTAPAKPVVNTDLTGKAGTKPSVEVTAEPGSTVALYDKDGNKIGEGTAASNGKVTIMPTVDIPVGNVTAKATDPSGNTSDASDPKVATDTTAPAKPVVNTDLTGKAGTKPSVEVTAEPGSTVALYDKDGNKIGEGTAASNGKVTITPTVDIPVGNVTAKATDPSGNTSVASDPKVATDTTAPAKPVVNTDLTGKAGTKPSVEVSAEPGSTVALYDKDNNKIGEATAGANGKATITPTVDIPVGNVTAKATDAAGNTSVASDPVEATRLRTDADKNDPTAKAQTVTPGTTPNAQDSIGNVADLPSGTTYEFKTPVDTATDGEKDATVVVTYPDGSKDEVPVKVTVKDPRTDADKNDPTAKAQTVTPGSTPNAQDSIGNVSSLPNGTIYAYKTPVDTTTEGDKDAIVVVTYPDGSTDEVPVKVTVKDPRTDADKNDPTAKAQTVTPGSTPNAQDSIGNVSSLPNGTIYAYKTPVDTTTEGDKDAIVVVTYPDGSTDEVPVKVTVKDPRTDADKNDPTAKAQTVTPGSTPNAQDSIGNVADLPSGTTYEFKTPVDTATDGEKDATVVVTYPDGSKDEVPVKVTVKTPSTDADNNTPVAKAQTVTPGTTPNAQDSIGNVADLPSGTTYEFKTPVDTATEGEKDATVVVTYPDGSKDEVPVKVTVKTPSTDADNNIPVAKAQTVTPGSTPNAQDSIGNVGDLPNGTKFDFKTPVDTATEGEKDATVVVTYPDGSKDEVPVKVTVKTPSTDADNNTPVAKAQTVTPGTTPNAQDSIGNVADLPSGTTYEFKTPVDTATEGEKDATVVVTYPDGSKDEVPVKVTVKTPSTDADNNTPVAKAQTVTPGSTPNAQDSIGNVGDLPNGTKFEFKTPVDTTTPGDKETTVVVTYPDGSTDEVPVTIKVIDPRTDADKNTPALKDQTVNIGETPNAQDSIGNVGDLPNGTKFDFKTPVDTATEGEKDATVVVTYPDGSTDEVPVTIKVIDPRTDADKNTPALKDQTVNIGETPKAQDSIGNVGDLPNGTTFEFKTPVDTTTSGDKETTVVVTYPDGSTDEVPVTIKVVDPRTDADKNTPALKDQMVNIGETPKAQDSIGNVGDLPNGTTFEFKTPVDTTTSGDKETTVVVTYPDGSTDEVPVTIKVVDPRTDADKNTPALKDQMVNIGETPKAQDSIGNVGDLPNGTTFDFKTPVDTTTPGDKGTTVVVTYPDGSTDEVPVTIKVIDPRTDADKNTPALKDQTVNIGETPKAQDSIGNVGDLPNGTKFEFKTPVDTTTPGDKGTTVVVTYPDGSTDEVPVTIKVIDPRTDADKNTPALKDQTVNIGETPNAQDSIGNVGDLPNGTKFEFKTPVDTTTPGDKETTVVVTYPDGSTDEVPVTIKVIDPRTDADKNTPALKDQTVNIGETPNAQDSIGNVGDLPNGTKFEFKTPVDTTTPGDKGTTVVVTYPDGSIDEVPVTIKVIDPRTDADKNTPALKDQTVNIGETPNAQDSIGNVGDLPNGTKFEFKTPVDTTTPGDKGTTVVVTYPDGSIDEVPVTIKVVDPRTDADKNTPTSTTPAPKAVPAPMMHKQTPASSAAPANPEKSSVSTATKKQALPETGDDASMSAMALGGILAAAGLGLAGKRKKED